MRPLDVASLFNSIYSHLTNACALFAHATLSARPTDTLRKVGRSSTISPYFANLSSEDSFHYHSASETVRNGRWFYCSPVSQHVGYGWNPINLQNRWTDRMFAQTHCMTVINFNIIPLATEYLQQLARIISTNYTQHVPVWLNDSIQVLRRYFSLMVWDAVKSLGMRNEMTETHVNANAHPTNDHNNEQQNPNYFTFQIVSHSQQPSRALAGAREWVLKEKRMFEAHGIAL